MDGFVHTNLLKRLDVAAERYDAALQANPSDSLAWLLKGTLHAFRDEGDVAVRDTEHALRLSPLDPQRYFYDSLAASARLTARDYVGALDLARRSLRANRFHSSTLRVLAVSAWQLGRTAEATQAVRDLLRIEPHFTISRYLDRTPAAAFPIGREIADVLRNAGVPD